jgi:hypothetical protein
VSIWPKQSVAALEAGYDSLPGSEQDKLRLKAVILRFRIEAVVLSITIGVFTDNTWPNHVRHKLLVSVGAPGLSPDQRTDRLRIVRRGASTYESLCRLLHGDVSGLHPPLGDLAVWTRAVDELEAEFARP